MKQNCLLFLIFLCCISAACAQARSPVKKSKKSYIRLVESYTQRTLPGMRGSPITTNTFFILVWEGKKYPETFFWRGERGWFPCNMLKAHKIIKDNQSKIPRGMDYRSEFVTGDNIHKGDTLLLSPVAGGKFPIPSEIPDTARNDLFFKTAGSGWLKFHVDTITKKRDLVMP